MVQFAGVRFTQTILVLVINGMTPVFIGIQYRLIYVDTHGGSVQIHAEQVPHAKCTWQQKKKKEDNHDSFI